MKESTVTTLVLSLLTLCGAISLMIVAPAHSNVAVCGGQAVAASSCR
jgi:hypothetical protein